MLSLTIIVPGVVSVIAPLFVVADVTVRPPAVSAKLIGPVPVTLALNVVASTSNASPVGRCQSQKPA
jgi:hypothetical protein